MISSNEFFAHHLGQHMESAFPISSQIFWVLALQIRCDFFRQVF